MDDTDKNFKAYVFKCKLAAQPVCVVYSVANGIRASLLEELGIWHPARRTRGNLVWVADYPIKIKVPGNDGDIVTYYDLTPGDTFTLS